MFLLRLQEVILLLSSKMGTSFVYKERKPQKMYVYSGNKARQRKQWSVIVFVGTFLAC